MIPPSSNTRRNSDPEVFFVALGIVAFFTGLRTVFAAAFAAGFFVAVAGGRPRFAGAFLTAGFLAAGGRPRFAGAFLAAGGRPGLRPTGFLAGVLALVAIKFS